MVRNKRLKIWTLLGLALLAACAPKPTARLADGPPMRAVSALDIPRYLGTWYEIARFPNAGERNCAGVTATYTLRDDGMLGVRNTCFKGTPQGRKVAVSLIGRAIEGAGGAKFDVGFLPWRKADGPGNYWVLYVSDDYQTAVVGSPSGRFLWLLARASKIDPATRATLNAQATAQGFDVRKLEEVLH
jgi:apolipoprotein D and lipocalin family protein